MPRAIMLPVPLAKSGINPKLPSNKSSIYELTRREARKVYRQFCKDNYPNHVESMMKEYSNALKGEPEDDGHQIQLSSLLAYYAFWF